MKVIQPNCRVQFTAEDIDFIIQVLGKTSGAQNSIIQLLTDDEARDAILDDEALFHAVLEQRGCMRISSHFHFYILVRHVFRRAGIEDRTVADYVAEVLAEFSRTERARCIVNGERPLDYLVDMLAALQSADERTRFCIRAHIGNHSLFLSGVFPAHIRQREARGFPNLRYYEELGRASYRVAGDHRLAYTYELAPIFCTLSERFEHTRRALNDLSDRLISLGDTSYSLDALLKENLN